MQRDHPKDTGITSRFRAMRIGYFTSIEGWGGSETYLKSLMLGVRERGHKPLLFGVDGTRLWDEAKAAGIEAIAWYSVSKGNGSSPQGARAARSAASVRFVKSVRRVARCLAPRCMRLLAGCAGEAKHLSRLFAVHPVDVMHVNVSGFEVAGLACRRVGIPTVAMNMITPPIERYWIRRWLMRHTLRRYDHVSSQSEYCTRTWAEMFGLDATSCSHVWNSPDVERFRPDPIVHVRRREDHFRIVSLGRLHPMKGYRYLVDAMAALNDKRASATVFGEGPLRKELESQIASLGLADSVQLPGYAEDPEVALRDADCFVLPSVSHESCPAVLAEAMASGLPLVTSDFGPLAEINSHGSTGLVVPARDPERLAQALVRLMNDPDLAVRMGNTGRRKAVESFSRELMIDKTLALYSEVLGSGGKSDIH